MSCSIKRMACAVLAALMVAVAAPAGELARPVPSNAQVTRFTRFNIRYSLRDTIADGVQKVEFYITDDMGATWKLYGEDADKTSPMTIEIPDGKEGPYGFVCVATDRYGNRERPPVARSRPETVIIVDRTPPEAKWLSPLQDVLGRGQEVELSWESSDDHMGEKPVKIQYAINAQGNHDRSANWLTLEENLAAAGSIKWSPPASGRFNFRMIVEDRAGNLTVAYNPATITSDKTPPTIQSVAPLRSNKLENDITIIAVDNPEGSGVKEYSLYTSDNGAASWVLVKETGVAGESSPVKRKSGESIAFKAPRSGEYPLWPVVFDNAGNATPLPAIAVAGPFILVIDDQPPDVSVSNSFLQGRDHVLVNDSRYVEWTSYDPHMEINSASIHLSLDNGQTWQEIRSGLATSGSESVTFPFGSTSEEAVLKVTVRDEFGNVGEGKSASFRLSAAETTIDAVTPRDPTTPEPSPFDAGPGVPSLPSMPIQTDSPSWGGWGTGLQTFPGDGLQTSPPSNLGATDPVPTPLTPSYPPSSGSDIFAGPAGGGIYGLSTDIYAPPISLSNESTASAIPMAKQGGGAPQSPLPPAQSMTPPPSFPPATGSVWEPSPNAGDFQTAPPTEYAVPTPTVPEHPFGSGLPTTPAPVGSGLFPSGTSGFPTETPPLTPPPAAVPTPTPEPAAPSLPEGLLLPPSTLPAPAPAESAPSPMPSLTPPPAATPVAPPATTPSTPSTPTMPALPAPPASVDGPMSLSLPPFPDASEFHMPSLDNLSDAAAPAASDAGLPPPPLDGLQLPAFPMGDDAGVPPLGQLTTPPPAEPSPLPPPATPAAPAPATTPPSAGLRPPGTEPIAPAPPPSATDTPLPPPDLHGGEPVPPPLGDASASSPSMPPLLGPDIGLPMIDGDGSPGIVAPPQPLESPSSQRPANPRAESDRLVADSRRFRTDDRRPDLALDSANRAVEADPQNPAAYMELSQVYARMEPPDYVRAANLAVRASELRADWETWWNCAEVYYIWAHAANREIQAMFRNGQTPPMVLSEERNSTLTNARIAINNATSVAPAGNREAGKKIANTSGMITYLQALVIPEPVNPGMTSGPAADNYRQQQSAYKAAVAPLLLEAMPFFQNARSLSATPEYNECFQLGIINFRLANLERDSGNVAQASTYYQEAIKFLEEATTAQDTPAGGPREAYYMLALSHGQLAEQPGANRTRHRELETRYWQQTVDFYEPGSPYHSYGMQRLSALAAEMGH